MKHLYFIVVLFLYFSFPNINYSFNSKPALGPDSVRDDSVSNPTRYNTINLTVYKDNRNPVINTSFNLWAHSQNSPEPVLIANSKTDNKGKIYFSFIPKEKGKVQYEITLDSEKKFEMKEKLLLTMDEGSYEYPSVILNEKAVFNFFESDFPFEIDSPRILPQLTDGFYRNVGSRNFFWWNGEVGGVEVFLRAATEQISFGAGFYLLPELNDDITEHINLENSLWGGIIGLVCSPVFLYLFNEQLGNVPTNNLPAYLISGAFGLTLGMMGGRYGGIDKDFSPEMLLVTGISFGIIGGVISGISGGGIGNGGGGIGGALMASLLGGALFGLPAGVSADMEYGKSFDLKVGDSLKLEGIQFLTLKNNFFGNIILSPVLDFNILYKTFSVEKVVYKGITFTNHCGTNNTAQEDYLPYLSLNFYLLRPFVFEYRIGGIDTAEYKNDLSHYGAVTYEKSDFQITAFIETQAKYYKKGNTARYYFSNGTNQIACSYNNTTYGGMLTLSFFHKMVHLEAGLSLQDYNYGVYKVNSAVIGDEAGRFTGRNILYHVAARITI